jgi:hypothetical protein
MKIIIIYIIVILVAIGAGYFLFQSSKQEPGDLPGEAIEIMNAIHIDDGSTDHPAYKSNPPTSGWHWPQPAACGVYDPGQPDERLIHNLEHGSIWITYKPDVDDATKTKLKDFAQRFNNIVVSARPANDSPIALAAWGRLQKMDSYDEMTIIKFIEAYMDKGPEKVQCAQMRS